MKLICFPFAGGDKNSFNSLKEIMPDEMEVYILEYPGRGGKVNQKLLYDINHIVEYAFQSTVKQVQDTPYIIYGHSMGALIGYLVCKKMESNLINRPTRLIVSGSKPPSKVGKEKLSSLSSEALWNKIYNYGGLHDEIKKNKTLKFFFEPIIRADFECVEKYQHNKTNGEKLTIPIDVFYGSKENISDEEIVIWKEETTQTVNIIKLEGNHFFIFSHKKFFSNYFTQISRIQ